MKNKWIHVLLQFIKIGVSVVLLLMVIQATKYVRSTGYDFGYRIFTESAIDEEPGTDILVQVTDNMSGSEIGTMLMEKGLIRDDKLFFLQYRLSAYYKKILPGVYTLNTSMTAKDMMVIMSTEVVEDTESTEAGEEVYNGTDEGTGENGEGNNGEENNAGDDGYEIIGGGDAEE